MYKQPVGFVPNGQLRDCDRCAFSFRWIQLRQQNGLWLCPQCIDVEIKRPNLRAGQMT